MVESMMPTRTISGGSAISAVSIDSDLRVSRETTTARFVIEVGLGMQVGIRIGAEIVLDVWAGVLVWV